MSKKKNELAAPLAALLKQAARLPAETGAAAQYKRRFEQATQAVVVLLDVSGSMAESAGATRKIDVLRAALEYALAGGEILIPFSSTPQGIAAPDLSDLPEPDGGTALHLALVEAARFHPRHTLVVSDGRPDDEQAALDAAAALSGVLDVIYCGPDDDTQAIAFMRRLASVGGGRVHVHDLRHHHERQQLRASVRTLLPRGRP